MGNERKIGFWWSLLLCAFASPIIGYLIIFTSTKKNEPRRNRNFLEILLVKVVGEFIGVLGVVIFYSSISNHTKYFNENGFIIELD